MESSFLGQITTWSDFSVSKLDSRVRLTNPAVEPPTICGLCFSEQPLSHKPVDACINFGCSLVEKTATLLAKSEKRATYRSQQTWLAPPGTVRGELPPGLPSHREEDIEDPRKATLKISICPRRPFPPGCKALQFLVQS
jgi:hypothetical protein